MLIGFVVAWQVAHGKVPISVGLTYAWLGELVAWNVYCFTVAGMALLRARRER